MDLCLLRIWGSGDTELQNRDSHLKKLNRSKPQQKIQFSAMKKIGFPLMKKIGIRLWRNVGLLLGEGERRNEKEERERGKRERESRWCLGLEVDMSLTRVPQRCMYLHYCHRYSFFRNWKQLKVVFNFRDSISIFWELSYGNWVRKLIQTKQVYVGPTKFRNWVMKTEYWMMKTLKPNKPLATYDHLLQYYAHLPRAMPCLPW